MKYIIHKAAKWGKLYLMKSLLDNGADINERDTHGFTPLDYAFENGESARIDFLKSRGAISGRIIRKRDDHLITLLIQMEQRANGAAPSRELINFVARHPDRINMTEEVSSLPAQALLHRAAFLGNKLVAAWLLIKGANINAVDGEDKTPLDHAVSKGDQDLASYLLSKGAMTGLDVSGMSDMPERLELATETDSTRSITEPAETPSIYVDNQDGTVTDTRTGLTWMRCASGQVWDGTTCAGEISTYTWDEAMALHSTYADHSDWRLPNIDELGSIVDNKLRNPAIDTSAFPIAPSSYFWSSSLGAHGSSYALLIGFEQGREGFDTKDGYFAVRHVRGGQSTVVTGAVNSDIDRSIEIAKRVANSPKQMPFRSTSDSSSNLRNAPNILAGSETLLSNPKLQEPKSIDKQGAESAASATVKRNGMGAPTQNSTLASKPNSDAPNEADVPLANDVILQRLARLEIRLDGTISRIEAMVGSLLTAQSEALAAINQLQQDANTNANTFASELSQLGKMLVSALQQAKSSAIDQLQRKAIPVHEDIAMDSMADITAWLVEQNVIPLSELRVRLLPLDLLPSAVIDDINERALDLTGEMALLESGDSVEVQQAVLKHVITAIGGQSVFTTPTN
jgi:hypothetical protein